MDYLGKRSYNQIEAYSNSNTNNISGPNKRRNYATVNINYSDNSNIEIQRLRDLICFQEKVIRDLTEQLDKLVERMNNLEMIVREGIETDIIDDSREPYFSGSPSYII